MAAFFQRLLDWLTWLLCPESSKLAQQVAYQEGRFRMARQSIRERYRHHQQQLRHQRNAIRGQGGQS